MSVALVVPEGGYELELGLVTLAVVLPLVVLFWSNRRLYPLAQREPALALGAALGQTIMVVEWFIDAHVAEIPYIWRKIISQICFLFLFGGFWFRAWKLWMDAGLAKERVQNKVGWFINHRHFRSERFLRRLKIGLVCFHAFQLIVALTWGSYTNLLPARVGTLVDPAVYFSMFIIFSYFVSFVVWSFLLSKAQDGFYIKTELRLVGVGCGLTTAVWFAWLLLRLPCSFANCRVFILWVSMVWMVSSTVIFPMAKAMKDPRFSYTACFYCNGRKKRTASSSQTTRNSENSKDSNSRSESSMDDYGFSDQSRADPLPGHRLSSASLLKLRRVNLASFLAYGPGKEAFRQFTVKEFSVENLLFIEAVQEFNANAQRTKGDCQALFDKFIAESGQNQINLPGVMKERITARLKDLEAGDTMSGLFDEASAHVMKLMQRDAFKRFQMTEDWVTHISVFKVEDKKKKDAAASEPESTIQVEVSVPADSIAPHESVSRAD